MAEPKAVIKPYRHPAGGWGSVKAVAGILLQEQVSVEGARVLRHQNKEDGFQCVSCSWAKPGKPHTFEFCENGAKATAWEITAKRTPPAFFDKHTCAELEHWTDYQLEAEGRLTHPMRWDAATDKYVAVSWESAFAEIGAELREMDPKAVVFYASGRASLETSYMYQLLARMYGTNNLPDSSNMCHESTSVALPKSIGVAVGTVQLEDFEHTDCVLYFGHNVGTNAPRMLHPLQDARKRNVPLIAFNPVREPGLVGFVNPQAPLEMMAPGTATAISSQFVQLKIGGDAAVVMGMCKHVIACDDAAVDAGRERVLDVAFINEHTHGLDAFADQARGTAWEEIERIGGVPRAEIEQAAETYMHSRAVTLFYGMGITQHRQGVSTIHLLVNLLLLRGNIGKPGAGICPVRGHSNVQGQRTVGITEKPELAPLDQLEKQYGFVAPRDTGLNTVEACEAMIDKKVTAFLALGGNFLRAVPDTSRVEPAWRRVRLSVNVATKLNRSHVVHGEIAYLLPCRGRIEIDAQAGGDQIVSMEDSTAFYHRSKGVTAPASEHLMSEPAIVAGIAKALLPPNANVDWDAWVADYGSIRASIETTYPKIFNGFNERLGQAGGFARPLPARQRRWETPNGRANFLAPKQLGADPDMPETLQDGVIQLMTMRGDNQFNTTVYGLDDRFRGVWGTRSVLFMNRDDMSALGLEEGAIATVTTLAHDGIERRVDGLRVTPFDLPRGCAGGYYPELNVLIPLSHYAVGSKVPAAKSIPVAVSRSTMTVATPSLWTPALEQALAAS